MHLVWMIWAHSECIGGGVYVRVYMYVCVYGILNLLLLLTTPATATIPSFILGQSAS